MQHKDIIKVIDGHREQRRKILVAKEYYENKNEIIKTGVLQESSNDGLRIADNRISHNYHQLLVDEKASYMFTYPVLFDLDGNTQLNSLVDEILGDDKESIYQDLCVEASNSGVSFLHYWVDENNEFQYDVVNSEEIIAIYDKTLKKNLINIYRYYQIKEEGKDYVIVEQWDSEEFTTYKFLGSIESSDLRFVESETIKHLFEAVPFIEFGNNKKFISDLDKYKSLVDLMDKVISGYANDIEDIQQIIMILENYGGANLGEFKSDLKKFKAVKVDGGPDGGSVKTLQIEIPVEARVKLTEILEKRIYESGQGLQQNTEGLGNASGVALKFFYRKLELKAGKTETQFKKGFNKLIYAILKFLNKDTKKITQTYSRNMIANDLENAQIAQQSLGTIPEKIILANHPWIEDVESALAMLEEERKEENPYNDFNPPKKTDKKGLDNEQE